MTREDTVEEDTYNEIQFEKVTWWEGTVHEDTIRKEDDTGVLRMIEERLKGVWKESITRKL